MASLSCIVSILLGLLAQGHCASLTKNLIWAEEFDTLDPAVWKHDITFGSSSGNWEFQAYDNNRTNSYVRDGVLYIKPTLTVDQYPQEGFLENERWDIWGNTQNGACTANMRWGCAQEATPENILPPVKSAKLRSTNSFNFKYGRVEVKAQFPRGDWLWSAIWLMPTYEAYGMWPMSGEIDIAEARGNDHLLAVDGNEIGNTHNGAALHWGPYYEQNQFWKTLGGLDSDFADRFHIFELDWQTDKIVSTFDGVEVLRVEPPAGGFWELGEFDQTAPGVHNPWQYSDFLAPFDQEFYFILNVAVGGTNGYFGDDMYNGAGEKPWINNSTTAYRDFWNGRDQWLPTWQQDVNNGESAALKIDYIRVYANDD